VARKCTSRTAERSTLADNTDASNVITDVHGECLDRGSARRGTALFVKPCDFGATPRFH
jgi:hypothetical protein